MPEAPMIEPTPEHRSLDRQLLLSILLPIAAAGISTIVGYIVAHWITITASKRAGYLVPAVALMVCAVSALLAVRAQRNLNKSDEAAPVQGRQFFLARLGLLLSGLAAILVFAGVLVLVTLHPND